jgi:hypothetical protein
VSPAPFIQGTDSRSIRNKSDAELRDLQAIVRDQIRTAYLEDVGTKRLTQLLKWERAYAAEVQRREAMRKDRA